MPRLCAQIDKLGRILANLGARIHWPESYLSSSSSSSSSSSNSNSNDDYSARLRPLVLDNLSLHTNLFVWSPQTERISLRQQQQQSMDSDSNKEKRLFESAALYIALCSYRNQLANHLVRVSFVSVALASSTHSLSSRFNLDTAYDLFKFLVTLFNREFIFRPGDSGDPQSYDQLVRDDFQRTLNCLLHLNVLKRSTSKKSYFFIHFKF